MITKSEAFLILHILYIFFVSYTIYIYIYKFVFNKKIYTNL